MKDLRRLMRKESLSIRAIKCHCVEPATEGPALAAFGRNSRPHSGSLGLVRLCNAMEWGDCLNLFSGSESD